MIYTSLSFHLEGEYCKSFQNSPSSNKPTLRENIRIHIRLINLFLPLCPFNVRLLLFLDIFLISLFYHLQLHSYFLLRKQPKDITLILIDNPFQILCESHHYFWNGPLSFSSEQFVKITTDNKAYR